MPQRARGVRGVSIIVAVASAGDSEDRHAKEIAEFEARDAAEAKAFADKLQEMAQSAKPAGKMTRPKGIAAMFT